MPKEKCECAGPGCPVVHLGKVCGWPPATRLYRVDMEDWTGVLFCHACAEDAWPLWAGLAGLHLRRLARARILERFGRKEGGGQ